jgi:hypothetical protein
VTYDIRHMTYDRCGGRAKKEKHATLVSENPLHRSQKAEPFHHRRIGELRYAYAVYEYMNRTYAVSSTAPPAALIFFSASLLKYLALTMMGMSGRMPLPRTLK